MTRRGGIDFASWRPLERGIGLEYGMLVLGVRGTGVRGCGGAEYGVMEYGVMEVVRRGGR
jgi:hypothetical protein